MQELFLVFVMWMWVRESERGTTKETLWPVFVHKIGRRRHPRINKKRGNGHGVAGKERRKTNKWKEK
jgi:hypothetical protein